MGAFPSHLTFAHKSCHHTTLQKLYDSEMDALSGSLAVVGAFKEVYLLAEFVYKIIHSASHYQEEEKSLVREFKIELLHLKSFWVVFTEADGKLLEDDPLNRVSRCFERQILAKGGIQSRLTQLAMASSNRGNH